MPPLTVWAECASGHRERVSRKGFLPRPPKCVTCGWPLARVRP